MTDFKTLYNLYAKDIYRFALFLCGNSEDAEDITAETFARAITGKSPVIDSTAKGYLLTIARNLFLESVRKRKQFYKLSTDHKGSEQMLEQTVIAKTELEALIVYLQTFDEIDRSALLLRGDGVGYAEIAKSLNISIASAKVRVHRVRLKLAQWRANREQD